MQGGVFQSRIAKFREYCQHLKERAGSTIVSNMVKPDLNFIATTHCPQAVGMPVTRIKMAD